MSRKPKKTTLFYRLWQSSGLSLPEFSKKVQIPLRRVQSYCLGTRSFCRCIYEDASYLLMKNEEKQNTYRK